MMFFDIFNSGLPSSFVSIHGCVTYLIEAIIEEPIVDEIHRTGKEITVEAPFHENLSVSFKYIYNFFKNMLFINI